MACSTGIFIFRWYYEYERLADRLHTRTRSEFFGICQIEFSEFFRIFRNFLEFFGRKNQEPDSATACTDRLGPSMRERKKGYHVTAALEVCSDVDRSVLSPLFRSHTYVTMYKMSYYILEHEMNDAFSARLRRLLHLRNCS